MTNPQLQMDGQPIQNMYKQLLYAEGNTEEEIGALMDMSRVRG